MVGGNDMTLLSKLQSTKNDKEAKGVIISESYSGAEIKQLLQAQLNNQNISSKLQSELDNAKAVYVNGEHPLKEDVFYRIYPNNFIWKIIRDVQKSPRETAPQERKGTQNKAVPQKKKLSFYKWLNQLLNITKEEFVSLSVADKHNLTANYRRYLAGKSYFVQVADLRTLSSYIRQGFVYGCMDCGAQFEEDDLAYALNTGECQYCHKILRNVKCICK